MLLVANVHAATYVSGPISTDTTWTKTNSPYRLTGNVIVDNGIILTIEPGVTVDFYAYTLQVMGTLNARGTSDNNIILFSSYSGNPTSIYLTYSSTNWNESTGTGSIIENSILSSTYISIVNCSPKISNNYFTNNRITSIGISGGSPLILNNAFNIQATGISITSGSSASPTISSNFIKCNSGSSSYGINAGNNNAYISDNNITGCYTGVYATGNSTITRNLIRSNTNGISISGSMATIENNIITSNNYGINGGGTVRNNTIGNNQVGILASIGSSNISQNNIFSNTQFSISMSTLNSIDATNNWWGTTDISAINQTIYDYKNSTMFGRVTFTPVLSDLNSAAPALESINYVPIPTPTPFPTPIPVPTNTVFIPRTTDTLNPISTPTPQPDPTTTPTAIPTPLPTPSPTPKIMPGSPLSLGGQTFAETLSQFDLMGIAKLVLIALGIMWVIIILSYVDRKFAKKENKNHNPVNS
jgi:hypothetical protein